MNTRANSKQGNIRTRNAADFEPRCRHCWAFLLLVIFFALALSRLSFAQFHVGSVYPLDSLAVANSAPSLTTSDDGQHAVAVWSGFVGGKRRIVLREQYFGEWLPAEILVDEDSAFENDSPQVGLDCFGNVYVAWIARTPSGDVIMIRVRRMGQWSLPLSVAIPTDQPTSYDDLSMALSSTFPPRLWLAWQANVGPTYTIYAATVAGTDGSFQVWEVAKPLAGAAYNISPQLLLPPREEMPTIVWYSTQESEFIPVMAQFSPPHSRWDLQVVESLAQGVVGGHLPRLVMTQDGFWTFWIEPSAVGDLAKLRFFRMASDSAFTSASEVTLSSTQKGERSGALSGAHARDANALLLAWIVDHSAVDKREHPATLRIAAALPNAPAQPVVFDNLALPIPCTASSVVVKPAGHNKAAILIASDTEYGGDGHVYYTEFSYELQSLPPPSALRPESQ